LGAWNALERTVAGLACLRRRDDLSKLRQLTEELLLTGAWTYTILFPFQTIAGITSAADENWEAAEAHHLTAIHQTDTAPYRHLQPVAREWYARMLVERNQAADREKAKLLLQKTIQLYESLGQLQRAAHARQIFAEL
jgi:hypothetical protein